MATETHDLTAQVDGAAVTFTTPTVYDAGSLVVHLNGVRLLAGAEGSGGNDFEEIGPGYISFAWNCPDPPRVGDTLQVQYEVGGAAFPFPVVIGSGQPPGSC